MRNINKYNDFVIEKEFESITSQIFKILESEEPVTYEWNLKKDEEPVTFEWDLTKPNQNTSVVDKLKSFLSKLPKEKVKEYFLKFLSKLSFLPEMTRKKLMVTYATAFLSVTSIGYLASEIGSKDDKVVKEFVKLTKKASFDISQEIVALAEGDYSDDKKDTGNFVDFELNGKTVQRFIGSKYGVSAPVLKEYLGRLPKKEDMINLSYETALDIYKHKYWDGANINEICNQSVANIIYDGCVNQGITGMKDVLRKAMNENGVKISDDDNPFNTDFVKNINIINQTKLFNSIKKFRESRYREAKTFNTHGNGWLDRLSKIEFKD